MSLLRQFYVPAGYQVPGFLHSCLPFFFSSENNKPETSKTAFQLELPVKYTVYTVISR